MLLIRWFLVLSLGLLLAGCNKDMELHTRLSEADANEVVAALIENAVPASKKTTKDGITVVIQEADIALAVQVLNARGLPRKDRTTMGEVFRKEGIISSPLEERARYIYALSQELEYTLSQIQGVIVARVHVVLPEKMAPGEPMQLSSAAVFIKHQAILDPDVASPKIKRMVASSIPGLADGEKDNIAIVFMPAQTSIQQFSSLAAGVTAQVEPVVHAPFVYNVVIAVLILLITCLMTVGRESFRQWLVKRIRQGNSVQSDDTQ
jgi:type III secretion protein J